MKIDLEPNQLLNLLDCLLNRYVQYKAYYKEHSDEEDFEGVISPSEIEDIYNNILKQVQTQGECTLLKPIGDHKN